MESKKKNRYRSKLEARIALTLPKGSTYECTTLKYRKRTRRKMVCQTCGGEEILQYADYLTDFRLPNGIYLEVKGWFKPNDRTKMESVIACNPEVDIRMVLQTDSWTTKLKKQRYSDWCNKRKIKYCIGTVPKEWMNE
jgi:hypothetical protein